MYGVRKETEFRYAVTVARFCMVFGRKPATKISIHDRSLRFGRIKFGCFHSLSAKIKMARCPTPKPVTHNGAYNSVETFETEKLQITDPNSCNTTKEKSSSHIVL